MPCVIQCIKLCHNPLSSVLDHCISFWHYFAVFSVWVLIHIYYMGYLDGQYNAIEPSLGFTASLIMLFCDI